MSKSIVLIDNPELLKLMMSPGLPGLLVEDIDKPWIFMTLFL